MPTPIALRRVHSFWFRFRHTQVWVWAPLAASIFMWGAAPPVTQKKHARARNQAGGKIRNQNQKCRIGGQNQKWPTSGQIGYLTPAVSGIPTASERGAKSDPDTARTRTGPNPDTARTRTRPHPDTGRTRPRPDPDTARTRRRPDPETARTQTRPHPDTAQWTNIFSTRSTTSPSEGKMKRNHSKPWDPHHTRTWVPALTPAHLADTVPLPRRPRGPAWRPELPGALKCAQLMWRSPIP